MTEHSGVFAGSSLPEKFVLGRQAMYSLPDEPRLGADVAASWIAHGLNPDLAPPEARQRVDVFRSACASVQERVAHNRRGERIQVLANEVGQRNGTCNYQITIRRWKASEIKHEETLTVKFDKATGQIDHEKLDGYAAEWSKLVKQIKEHYAANTRTVPGQKIRNAIRETLLDRGAQNLRGNAGGVYFVPKQAPADGEVTLPVLEGLAGVLHDLYGDRADFDVTKYANDEGEREIVRKHFASNANETARELAEKAWSRVRQGRGERGVRSDLIANLESDRRVLLGQVRHFKELVNLEASDVQASLDELDDALAKLDKLANEPAPGK